MPPPFKIALVLAGGGSLGAVQPGMLGALMAAAAWLSLRQSRATRIARASHRLSAARTGRDPGSYRGHQCAHQPRRSCCRKAPTGASARTMHGISQLVSRQLVNDVERYADKAEI
jgi:hypothetical protein